jgi:hypothetical protein
MAINLPRLGTGLESVFEGNPIKLNNVSGRLKVAGENVQTSEINVKQTVQKENTEAARDAQEHKSFIIDVKA